MKQMMNQLYLSSKYKKLSPLILFTATIAAFACFAATTQAATEDELITTCQSFWPDPDDKVCDKDPDRYEIVISEMGVCTSEPMLVSESTKNNPVDQQIFTGYSITADCTATLKTSGTIADLSTGTVLLGNEGGSRPINATYTHAYFIMNNTFGLKGSHTIDGNTYNSNSDGRAIISTSLASPQAFTETLLTFDSEECSTYGRSAGADLPSSLGGGTMKALLIKDGSIASCSGTKTNAAKIFISYKPSQAIYLTDATKGIEVNFTTTKTGLQVDGQDWEDESDCSAGGQEICSFRAGPFLPSMSSF